jgi:hypothetical protein
VEFFLSQISQKDDNAIMEVTSSPNGHQKSIDVNEEEKLKQSIPTKEMKLYIKKLREEDQKTIKELANEVKRLTKLIPRKTIEEDEKNEVQNGETVGENDDKNDNDGELGSSLYEQTTITGYVGMSSSLKNTDLQSSFGRNNSISYSFWQVVFSFSLGALLMLMWLWRYLPT